MEKPCADDETAYGQGELWLTGQELSATTIEFSIKNHNINNLNLKETKNYYVNWTKKW